MTQKHTLYIEVYVDGKASSDMSMFCTQCGREMATFRDLADCWIDHDAKDMFLIFLYQARLQKWPPLV